MNKTKPESNPSYQLRSIPFGCEGNVNSHVSVPTLKPSKGTNIRYRITETYYIAYNFAYLPNTVNFRNRCRQFSLEIQYWIRRMRERDCHQCIGPILWAEVLVTTFFNSNWSIRSWYLVNKGFTAIFHLLEGMSVVRRHLIRACIVSSPLTAFKHPFR